MSRTIKFRAWNGEVMDYSPDLVTPKGKLSPKGLGWLVIMQFTGLLDKNGKEIYEGDIVRYNGKTYVIIWENIKSQFEATTNPKKEGIFFLFTSLTKFKCETEFEVIGNIYEHPNFLKEVNENGITRLKRSQNT